MGAPRLKLQWAPNYGAIMADPQIDWSFDTLLLELNTIETMLSASSISPLHFTKAHSRETSTTKGVQSDCKVFRMHVSDEETGITENDNEEEEIHGQPLALGRQFECHELHISDTEDSEDESTGGAPLSLMKKVGLVEGALAELGDEYQHSITEVIRNRISALEVDLMNEKERFSSALSQVEKNVEIRKEMDRKLDMQYQRRIAEALDNHLTAVQRDHEYKSQIEEKKIRDDAAFEEAKRKQKALQEEKLRQEKIKAAEEARLQAEKKRDEEAKAAALEAEMAASHVAEVVSTESSFKAAASMPVSEESFAQSKGSEADGLMKAKSPVTVLKGSESALKLEERRLQIYADLAAKNEALGMNSNKEYRNHAMQIARRIKTITGTKESVRAKAGDLIRLLKSSSCPQSISVAMFVEKIVSQVACSAGSFNPTVYAYGHVIVIVTSQVPHAMDILLAELNRACIFTVPKHLSYSKSAFQSKEAYYKAIGYQEEDGNLESTDSYVMRLSSYIRLYGALVQTEVQGCQNLHGIHEGWAWLARLLNTLPANHYTAVALEAFLEMAGFALYKAYKSQFQKLLDVVSMEFLRALKEKDDPKLAMVVTSLQDYLVSKKFLEEPEGRKLQGSLLSSVIVVNAESEYSEPYHYLPDQNRFRYQR